jgi:dTDP-4-amino-4,6-dideoxygalactose transaminase
MFRQFTKVPRGSINHSLFQSFVYLINSFFARLNQAEVINEFEELFAKNNHRKYCVSFPFARTAIYFALKAQNLPKGSEIIMPPISIKGILDVVISLGLIPKYVDLDLENFCFDSNKLKKAINKNTSAIIITYLFGTAPDVGKLIAICKLNNIFIIEDFSQGLNAKSDSAKLGSFGDASIYSSSAIKQIDTFGGGHLVSNDKDLIEKIRLDQLNLYPSKRTFLIKKILINLMYNIAANKIVFNLVVDPLLRVMKRLGSNVDKMTGDRDKFPIQTLPREWFGSYTSFQAKIGIDALKNLESFDKKRILHAHTILNLAKKMNFGQRKNKDDHTYWQLVAYAENPSAMIEILRSNGVDSCTSSLELLSALSNYPGSELMTNAIKIHTRAIFIPCFARLSNRQKQKIYKAIDAIKDKSI